MSCLDVIHLKSVVRYDAETGKFYRLKSSRRSKPGDETGKQRENGYSYVSIDGRIYYAHRLAWLYVYGKWPDQVIDHINGNKSDNRICNLRDISRRENVQSVWEPNKNHGLGNSLGVHFSKRLNKWVAQIRVQGKATHIGCFVDEKEAAEAYINAKRELHKGFLR